MAEVMVLFEVKPTEEGLKRYGELGAMLRPMLQGFEGFIRADRFVSPNEERKSLSINVWADEEAVARWRNLLQHRLSQQEGREKLFEYYKITVCSVLRTYTDKDRTEAPEDSNRFLL